MILTNTIDYFRRRRAERTARGLCISCNNKPRVRKSGKLKGQPYLHCDECRAAERVRFREKHGLKTLLNRDATCPGRPIIEDEDVVSRRKEASRGRA